MDPRKSARGAESEAAVERTWLQSVPMDVIAQIVRMIVDGNAEGAERESRKARIQMISRLGKVSKLMRDATNSVFGYVVGLSPVRAVATDMMLSYMAIAGFTIELVRSARESPSNALLPRIAELARDHHGGSLVADALHGKLAASLRKATVRGGPMYGSGQDLDSLAREVIERLKGPMPFTKIMAGRNYYYALAEFTSLPLDGRRKHALQYGPMCIWDVSGGDQLRCPNQPLRRILRQVFPALDLDLELAFNSDLYWDVSSATNMSRLFEGNGEFNGDLSHWDVSRVLDMERMFRNSGIQNSGIGHWDVRSLATAKEMFTSTTKLSRDLNLSRWNVQRCEDLTSMFSRSSVFDSGIGNWELPTTANTNGMFRKARLFQGKLGKWSAEHLAHANAPEESRARASQAFGVQKGLEIDELVFTKFTDSLRARPETRCVVS